MNQKAKSGFAAKKKQYLQDSEKQRTALSYSQQGSLKPQFLQIASLLPATTPMGKPQLGQFCVSFSSSLSIKIDSSNSLF
jgi:hypothetical protein